MNRKKMLAFAGAVALLLGTVGTLWALNAAYNRPNPLMDYVPQEIGIYDTMYSELNESACRSCHGNSLADRHHLSDTVVVERKCTPCHDTIPNPPGVNVYRNCVVDAPVGTGCHSWDSVYTNGWHHNTDLSGSENCTACHNPNLVAQISPFRSLEQYPPSVVTPTPFSCENCHWGQAIQGSHPASYDHYNIWGQPYSGLYSYGKVIKDNFDTHHMGFKGNVASQCYKCHSADPTTPSWDPTNPELIRYCMICHDIATLHILEPHQNGDVPHVGDIQGWEAVGFHAGGSTAPPTTYTSFTADQQCFACHADLIPDPPAVADCSGYVPAINITNGISPTAGTCTAIVTLRGVNFGEDQYEDSHVEMRLGGTTDPWTTVYAYSWTETQIEFEIPCWTFTKGNYKVRVKTACGPSNAVNFSLNDWGTLLGASPDSGPCSTTITLTGSGFGATKNVTPDLITGEGGVARFVDFVGSQGTYTATKFPAWSSTSVQVKFQNFFRDDSEPRNFVADGSDPVVTDCNGGDQVWLGSYQIYFVTVYYTDTDLSGGLTVGDVITQTTFSDPESFELTADPVIFRLNPDKIDLLSKLAILGQNYGPYQTTGEVRGGAKIDAQNAALGQGLLFSKVAIWSNTKVKVKFNPPGTWAGKTKYVWIEKDGKKSNFKPIKVN